MDTSRRVWLVSQGLVGAEAGCSTGPISPAWGGALGKPGVLATSGGEEPAQLYFEFREGCYSLHFDSFSF